MNLGKVVRRAVASVTDAQATRDVLAAYENLQESFERSHPPRNEGQNPSSQQSSSAWMVLLWGARQLAGNDGDGGNNARALAAALRAAVIPSRRSGETADGVQNPGVRMCDDAAAFQNDFPELAAAIQKVMEARDKDVMRRDAARLEFEEAAKTGHLLRDRMSPSQQAILDRLLFDWMGFKRLED